MLEVLRENGLEENTLVFFTSDNGAPDYIGLPDVNRLFRGWKISFFEGGIHVPHFVKWPARLAAHDAEQAEPAWPSLVEMPVSVDKTLLEADAADDEYSYWSS